VGEPGRTLPTHPSRRLIRHEFFKCFGDAKTTTRRSSQKSSGDQFSLLGSTLLHGVALPLSLKFVKPAEFAEDAIEVVVLDEPKVEETKPELAIQEKVSPPPETFKPEPPPEPTPPEEPSVAATPPPIPEEPRVATTPPPIPEEPPVATTPPPIPEEPRVATTPPPAPRKSEPVVRTVPPKSPRNLPNFTDARNPNFSDSGPGGPGPGPGGPGPGPGGPGPGGPGPGGPGPGGPGPGGPGPGGPGPGGRGPGGAPLVTCISGCGKPNYPIAAREKGREGRVELICDIDPNGKTFNIDILTPSKYNDLNKAARKTVEERRYAPSESGIQGERIVIIFRLTD
jgi:TonB family protein